MGRRLGLFVVLASACGRPVTSVGHEPLRAQPPRLELRAYVGHPVRAAVTITNPDRAPVGATLSVASPFSASPLDLSLGAAETLTVDVTFAPPNAGTFSRELVLSDTLGAETRVPLEGVGLAVPVCTASGVCREARFDTVTEACVDANQPDETPCVPELSCYASASCRSGVCRGVLSAACVDGDACTIDACGTEGCLHVRRECPVTDPCLVATCDPLLGCGTAPVTDGTSCGPSRCEDAYICLGGRCALAPRPNAPTDCRYTDVAAARTGGCALSVGGDVKCWGSGRRPRRLPSLQGILPNSLDGESYMCGVRPGGAVSCVWFYGADTDRVVPPEPLPFSRPAIDVLSYGATVCARVDDDSLECLQLTSDAGVSRSFDAGTVRAWSLSDRGPCVVLPDGGARCSPQVPPPPQVAVTVLAAPSTTTAGLTPGGAVWCGPSLCGPDAGATMLGALYDQVCWLVDGDTVGCVNVSGNWPLVGDRLPGPVSLLTSTRQSHLYALVDGKVWAAGWNALSALGEYSVNPLEVSKVPMGASAMTTPDWAATVVAVDGGLRRLGISPLFVPLPAGVEPVQVSRADTSRTGEWSLLTRDGGAYYGDGEQLIRRVALPGPATAVAGVHALAAGHAWDVRSGDDLGPAISISRTLVLQPDGGGIELPVPLRQLSERSGIGHGCGLTSSGGALCWDRRGDAGLQLHPIAGLRPGASFITSDMLEAPVGCALFPPSGVQCWGAPSESLPAGTPAPPTRYTAVDVVVGEPIVSLSTVFGHTCALTRSGVLACWGDNSYGPFGFEPLWISQRFIRVPW